MLSRVLILLFLFHIPATYAKTGSVLEIDNPSVTVRTHGDGNLTLQAGEHGSLYFQTGTDGTVMYRDIDLLSVIETMRSLPPIWETSSSVGFVGSFIGGDEVNVTLKAKDPEEGELFYSVVAGSLPPGVVIDEGLRIIRGIAPDEDAIFIATIRVTDIHKKYADAVFRFQISDNNRCDSTHPCLNGGICVDQINTYICQCVGIYGGKNCEKVCSETSLGVATNTTLIPDARMSAYRGIGSSLASDGRLTGKGWCGQPMSWLQIDLGDRKRVERVLTDSTTSSYEISYSVDGDSFNYFTANTNTASTTTIVSQKDYRLPVSLYARFIRLSPIAYSGSHPCLKVEIFGCDTYY